MKFKAVYLWALLPVLVVVGWVIAFYEPVSSKNHSREKEVLQVKAEELNLDNEISRLTALRKKEGETKSRIEDISAHIPRWEKLPEFMKSVALMAKGKGILIQDFSVVPSSLEEQRTTLVANPIFEVSVKGRYLQIGRFLEDLADNKAFKGVVTGAISYDEKEYPVLTGRFVLQFKARKE
jgi:Tfp pilus assembly protein PilO